MFPNPSSILAVFDVKQEQITPRKEAGRNAQRISCNYWLWIGRNDCLKPVDNLCRQIKFLLIEAPGERITMISMFPLLKLIVRVQKVKGSVTVFTEVER